MSVTGNPRVTPALPLPLPQLTCDPRHGSRVTLVSCTVFCSDFSPMSPMSPVTLSHCHNTPKHYSGHSIIFNYDPFHDPCHHSRFCGNTITFCYIAFMWLTIVLLFSSIMTSVFRLYYLLRYLRRFVYKFHLPLGKTSVCNRNKTHFFIAPDSTPYCSGLLPYCSGLSPISLHSNKSKLTDIRFFKARAQHIS